MCLAVPMQIKSISGDNAIVEVAGTSREVNISFIDSPAIGKYVLVHAGFAIKSIDEKEAIETATLLNKMASYAKKEG